MKGRAAIRVGTAACALLAACSGPVFIDRVTIENRTAYSATVAVTGGDQDGLLSLGIVGPDSERAVHHVIDQGNSWIFRFDYLGKYEEQIQVSKQDLERSNWRVEVPQSFEQALREMGIPPPP